MFWVSAHHRFMSMERQSSEYFMSGRLPAALGMLGVGAGAVTWLAPGGLGEAGPVKVTDGTSASGYRSVVETMADAPAWLGPLLEIATEGTLVVLGILLVWMFWA